MKKNLIAVILIFALLSLEVKGQEESVFIYTVEYIYDNRGDVSYYLTEDDVTLPLSWDCEWQQVKIINSSHAFFENKEDIDGNHITVMDIGREVIPESNISFKVTYHITSITRETVLHSIEEAELKDSIPQSLIDKHCSSTSTFNYETSQIEEVASRLAGEDEKVLTIVTSLVDWILTNFTYGNYDLPRYPNETLSSGDGDCDDQAILLISMLRSQNIPSFLQLGIVFNERIQNSRMGWDDHLEITQEGVGWHGWAMVYIPPWGWTPIDLTLTQKDKAIEIINDPPQDSKNIVPFLNVNNQEYIDDASNTRNEIINSTIHVIVTEKGFEPNGKSIYNNWLLMGTSIALVTSIIVMIYLGRND